MTPKRIVLHSTSASWTARSLCLATRWCRFKKKRKKIREQSAISLSNQDRVFQAPSQTLKACKWRLSLRVTYGKPYQTSSSQQHRTIRRKKMKITQFHCHARIRGVRPLRWHRYSALLLYCRKHSQIKDKWVLLKIPNTSVFAPHNWKMVPSYCTTWLVRISTRKTQKLCLSFSSLRGRGIRTWKVWKDL